MVTKVNTYVGADTLSTKKHSSQDTYCLFASIATTRCHSQRGPQMNKFEQISSEDHQMSLAGGQSQAQGCQVWCQLEGGWEHGCGQRRFPGLIFGGRGLYSEVQCIMSNDHIGTPVNRQTNRHKWKHYLLATSSAGGNESNAYSQVHVAMELWNFRFYYFIWECLFVCFCQASGIPGNSLTNLFCQRKSTWVSTCDTNTHNNLVLGLVVGQLASMPAKIISERNLIEETWFDIFRSPFRIINGIL